MEDMQAETCHELQETYSCRISQLPVKCMLKCEVTMVFFALYNIICKYLKWIKSAKFGRCLCLIPKVKGLSTACCLSCRWCKRITKFSLVLLVLIDLPILSTYMIFTSNWFPHSDHCWGLISGLPYLKEHKTIKGVLHHEFSCGNLFLPILHIVRLNGIHLHLRGFLRYVSVWVQSASLLFMECWKAISQTSM